ncbi:hypothetical protein [Nocardia arthritidis]|uniref:hypothetical protein n=1 Tax=Nocardia arthritidis TaxID=228602 RepID=UPI0007A38FA1
MRPVIGTDAAESYFHQLYNSGAATGTPDQIIDNLTKVRDLGLGYAVFNFPESAYDTSGIELFEREVLPDLPAS